MFGSFILGAWGCGWFLVFAIACLDLLCWLVWFVLCLWFCLWLLVLLVGFWGLLVFGLFAFDACVLLWVLFWVVFDYVG